MTVQCCICFREKIEGRWVDKGHTRSVPASHGYCETCYGIVISKMLQDIASQVSPSTFLAQSVNPSSAILGVAK